MSSLDKVRGKIEELQTKRNELASEMVANQKKISEYDMLVQKKTNLENSLKEIKEQPISDNTDFISELKNDLSELHKTIEKYKADFEGGKQDLDDLSHVKELFSSTGIRSSIIKRIVDVFNKILQTYLSKLEAPCKISFDENFDPTITTLGGILLSFDNLSSGEQHRVNTALSFTFKDILRIQNKITFNVSIIDEVMDTSIDKKALDKVGDILRERFENYGESCYIISHRVDFGIEGSEEILVVKENGLSRIVE